MKNNFFYLTFVCSLCFSIPIWGQFITTVAGNDTAGFRGDGGAATAAEMYDCIGVTVSVSGNLYIADFTNNRVRMVDVFGNISTIAGNGTGHYSGDGGPATLAELQGPDYVATDLAGNLYITDAGNNRIRKVNTSGIISTVAGSSSSSIGDGGPATLAELLGPAGIAIDTAGNLFVVDGGGNSIRKVNPAGIITTIAGTGASGYSGDGGPATLAQFRFPRGIVVDIDGNLYIADYANNCVRKINSSDTISTIAGTGYHGFGGDGGPATAAFFANPCDVSLDIFGNIYVTDYLNQRLRKINTAGIITTIAGTGTAGFSGDGCAATAAELNYPFGVFAGAEGKVYIGDYGNNVIRMIYSAPAPHFAGGRVQFLAACASIATSINALLAVMDTAIGMTDTWSVVALPAHGSLVSSYTITSTGGILTPTGLSYTSAGGYFGMDTFMVQVSDCGNITDTATIIVSIDSFPVATVITGSDSVCLSHTDTLSDISTGGVWGSSNMRATISGGVVAGVTPGLDTIFYIVSNVCGADTVSDIITIKDCPNDVQVVPKASELNLTICPNPNVGAFTITLFNNTGLAHIVISNIIGEKVNEITTVCSKPLNIDIDEPAGTYFISVSTSDGMYNAKVIIAK